MIYRRCLNVFLTALLSLSPVSVRADGAAMLKLPAPGISLEPSGVFSPTVLSGMVIDPKDPFKFRFVLNKGNLLDARSKEELKSEANKLVKYFLSALTIPDNDIWVNLSPYEKDRITSPLLAQTDLGKDLLMQDYILKQFSASLINPQKEIGREFWVKVYDEAKRKMGNVNIPVNTYNKVWIMPDEARIYVQGNAVYINKASLKVMTDKDYLAIAKNNNAPTGADTPIFKEIIIPAIAKEVNTGKHFANLRQIYASLILAKWYKNNITKGALAKAYNNQNKISGINLDDLSIKDRVFQQYLAAFKKGVFNFIKDESSSNGEIASRKYFSGGMRLMEIKLSYDSSGPAAFNDEAMMTEVDFYLRSIPSSKKVWELLKSMRLSMSIGIVDHKGPFDLPSFLAQLIQQIELAASKIGNSQDSKDFLMAAKKLYRVFKKIQNTRYNAHIFLSDEDYMPGEEIQTKKLNKFYDDYINLMEAVLVELKTLDKKVRKTDISAGSKNNLLLLTQHIENVINPVLLILKNKFTRRTYKLSDIFNSDKEGVNWEYKKSQGAHAFKVKIEKFSPSAVVVADPVLLKRAVERIVENAQAALNRRLVKEVRESLDEDKDAVRKRIISDIEKEGEIQIAIQDEGSHWAIVTTNPGKMSNDLLEEATLEQGNLIIRTQQVFLLNFKRSRLFEGGIGSSFIFFTMLFFRGSAHIANVERSITDDGTIKKVGSVKVTLRLPKANAAQIADINKVNGGIDLKDIGVIKDNMSSELSVNATDQAIDPKDISGLTPVITGLRDIGAIQEIFQPSFNLQ